MDLKSLATMCEVTGTGLIAVGLWWVYPPVALIFLGVALFAVSYLLELSRRYPERADRQPASRDRVYDDVVVDQELAPEPEEAEAIPAHVRTTKGGLVRA